MPRRVTARRNSRSSSTYRSIGIPVVTVSAKRGTGLDELKQRLQGRRTLLAGQSGVGKTSLTNALCEGVYRATSELSAGLGPGQAHHRVVGHRPAALGRTDGLPRRAGLRPARHARAGHPAGLPRDHPAGPGLPVPELPAPAGAPVRRAGGGRGRRDRSAAARKLPPAGQPDPPAGRKAGLARPDSIASRLGRAGLPARPDWYDAALQRPS